DEESKGAHQTAVLRENCSRLALKDRDAVHDLFESNHAQAAGADAFAHESEIVNFVRVDAVDVGIGPDESAHDLNAVATRRGISESAALALDHLRGACNFGYLYFQVRLLSTQVGDVLSGAACNAQPPLEPRRSALQEFDHGAVAVHSNIIIAEHSGTCVFFLLHPGRAGE